MPSEIIHFKGGGGAIVHTLRRAPRCAYCNEKSTKLCDHPIGGGRTCDKPMCNLHATRGSKPNTDFCREHKKS